jgi:hypothetical protein
MKIIEEFIFENKKWGPLSINFKKSFFNRKSNTYGAYTEASNL